MRVKVELSRSVQWDLTHRFAADVDDFYQQLRQVQQGPIRYSEPFTDLELGRYVFRYFPFGRGVEKIAIFAFFPTQNLIKVIECRLSEPRRMRNAGGHGGGPRS